MAFDLNANLRLQSIDTSSVRGSINRLNSQLSTATSKARTFSDAIALKGISLTGYTAVALVIGKLSESFARATNDAIRFEYELAKIAQTVNQTNSQVREHSESIRKMSVDYGLSAPKIAETIRVLSQAGYTFSQAKAAADSLSQSTLLASFESLSDTTDGLIAINKQFTSTMGDSARVIALLNNVSKKYAVESSDLVEATRKAGGVFSATGGSLEELVAIFTTVRDTTRESAETIATGLRTIFSRLQRPKTIDYLKQFGIELVNLKGNFVGNFEAIKRIQQGIADNKIDTRSTVFAGIVEAIGGIRQQSRVIPLLTQGAKLQNIWNETQKSGAETSKDLAKAQETLSFRLSELQQNFSKFVNDIVETESFKLLTSAFISLSNAAIAFGSSIKELIPLLSALFAFKLGSSIGAIFSRGLVSNAILTSRVKGFATGGPVGTDTIPAMLSPGEFVVNAASSKAFGYSNLEKINKYAKGGVVRNGVSYFTNGGKSDDINRNVGDVVTDINQAKKILAEFLSTFSQEVQDAVGKVKVKDISGDSSPSGTLKKGSYRPLTNQVGVNLGNARAQTIAHEGGHAVDAALAGGGKLASEQPGSFQNQLAVAAKTNLDSTIRAAVGSDKAAEYRLKEAEIFSDLLAKSSPAVRKILTSTLDAAEGSEALAQYLAKEGANEGRLYGDIHLALQDRVKAIRKQIIAESQANLRQQQPQPKRVIQDIPEIPVVKQFSLENAGLGPASGNTASSRRHLDTKPIISLQQAYNARIDNLGLGSAIGGSSLPSNLVTPAIAAKQAAFNRSQENAGLGGAIGNTTSIPQNYDKAASGQLATNSAKLTSQFGIMTTILAGTAQQYVSADSELAKFSPTLASVTSSMLTVISTLGILQTAMASLNIQLSAQQWASGLKDILGRGGLLGKLKIPSGISNLFGTAGSKVGSFASKGSSFLAQKLPNFTNAATAISGGVSKENLVSAGKAAAGFLAAGAAAYGFGKAVDAARDLEGKRTRAIEQGNTVEAGKASVTLQAQEDINKLAVGAALVGTAFGGPIAGALAGFATKLIGMTSQGEYLANKARDAGAALGILESNALISARNRLEAANNDITKNIQQNKNVISKRQQSLGSNLNSDQYFGAGEFKSVLGKLNASKTEADKIIKEQNQKISDLGNDFGSGAGTAAAAADAEITKVETELREKANEVFSAHEKGFTVALDEFIADGGTDWTAYLDSLEKAAAGNKDLILLSDNAKVLQEQFKNGVRIMKEEADIRLLNFQILQRTAPALLALEKASKKASAIVGFGGDTANLTSGNFQANSLTNGANSDNVKIQAAVAKTLGIKDYENIIGGSTKAKEDIKKATEAYNSAGSDNPRAQAEFKSALQDIILAGDPKANESVVDKLSITQLQEAADKIGNAGDEVKDKLVDAATKTDQGANQLKAAFDKRIEAEAALNQAIFDTIQSRNSRVKDLESFRGSGTVQSDILSRRIATDESGRAEAARNNLAQASSGTGITKARIAELQATQAAGGNIDAEELKTLQSTLLVFDSAMKSATATINLDTQQRLANIESLKESLAIEKSRTDSFKATGKKLLYGSEEEKFKEKIALRRGAKIESQLASGNGAGAIRSTQQASALGLDVGSITSKFSARNQERFGIAEDAEIARVTRGGAYGNEFQSIQQSDTTREGSRIFGDIARQEQGLRGNEDALNVAKAEEAKSAIMAADRFGSFVNQMDGSLKTFSTQLSNIVDTLQNSSITMKLDTTRVDVNLGDPAMFASLQEGLRNELMTEISRKINELAMGQGQ